MILSLHLHAGQTLPRVPPVITAVCFMELIFVSSNGCTRSSSSSNARLLADRVTAAQAAIKKLYGCGLRYQVLGLVTRDITILTAPYYVDGLMVK